MDENPSPALACAAASADAQDHAWMRRIKTGDMEAFQQLVEAHQVKVVGTIARMLGNEAEAEDIAQQVFLRIWNSAARYEPSAKFTTWLYTIVRNLVFNETRRRQRHPTVSLDAAMESPDGGKGGLPEKPDPQVKSPDVSLLDHEMQEAIQQAIDSLPEVQRLAIVLRRYQDVSYEEMAEILGLTVPAVKSVLFRARTELRERLKSYLAE